MIFNFTTPIAEHREKIDFNDVEKHALQIIFISKYDAHVTLI